MHCHFSIVDCDGSNVFVDGSTNASTALVNAFAGCLAAMAGSSLIFAPFDDSCERLVPYAYAPTTISWGYDNRTTVIHIPSGAPMARRIENRVAGGAANPYLLLAAMLGAA